MLLTVAPLVRRAHLRSPEDPFAPRAAEACTDGTYFFRSFADHPFSTGAIGSPASPQRWAFAGAGMASYLFPRTWPAWILLAAGCAFTSGVAAGAHILSDVTLAAVAGLLVARGVWQWQGGAKPQGSESCMISVRVAPRLGLWQRSAMASDIPSEPFSRKPTVRHRVAVVLLALMLVITEHPRRSSPRRRSIPASRPERMWQCRRPAPRVTGTSATRFQPPAGWLEHARLAVAAHRQLQCVLRLGPGPGDDQSPLAPASAIERRHREGRGPSCPNRLRRPRHGR
jgi:hypothetical protein